MPNYTTNFSFSLPLVADPIDADLWGGFLNSNWTALDTALDDAGVLPAGGFAAPADSVDTAAIQDSAVTKEKIEDVADMTLLGNVSGSAAAPAEVSILDEDDMASDSATAVPTQQSVKAYVDTEVAASISTIIPLGLITFTTSGGVTTIRETYGSCVGASVTRNSTGQWTISKSGLRSGANHPVFVTGTSSNAGATGILSSPAPTADAIKVFSTTVGGGSISYDDATLMSVSVW